MTPPGAAGHSWGGLASVESADGRSLLFARPDQPPVDRGPGAVVAHLAEQAGPGFDVGVDRWVLDTRADHRECDVVLITKPKD